MPKTDPWTADDLPDLSGKTIVVTGGNSGLGYEAALQFARKRAHVVLACRDSGKARARRAPPYGPRGPGAALRLRTQLHRTGLDLLH